MPTGESGLAGARNSEPQHDPSDSTHVRRGPAPDLHPDAPGLVPAIRQQRAVPAGGPHKQRTSESVRRLGYRRRDPRGRDHGRGHTRAILAQIQKVHHVIGHTQTHSHYTVVDYRAFLLQDIINYNYMNDNYTIIHL